MERVFTKRVLFFVLGFVLVIFSLGVIAQERESSSVGFSDREAGQPRSFSGKILKELDLTPEQVQKIREVNQKMRPALRRAIARLRQANLELDEAIYANEIDETTVMQKLEKFQDAQAEVAKLRIQLELEFRKILTAGQIEKFRHLRQRRPRPNTFSLPE